MRRRMSIDERILKTSYTLLANEATNGTAVYSSYSLTLKHPAVRAIVYDIGKDVLPFIFYDLSGRSHWGCHWRMAAINEILYQNGLPPVKFPKRYAGRVVLIWLFHVKYGVENGYLRRWGFWFEVRTWLRIHLLLIWHILDWHVRVRRKLPKIMRRPS